MVGLLGLQSTLDKKWYPEGKELRNTGWGHPQGVTCQGRSPSLQRVAAPLLLLPEWEGAQAHSWPYDEHRTSLW